jgi:hypothetical protein
MTSTTETGHAKNAANFEELIAFCTGYGASYNPSKASILLAALNAKRAEAINALAAVNASLPPWTNAVSARELAFNPLSKLITRVINAAVASDISKQIVDNIKTIARKLQGRRASAKKETASDHPEKSSSASQMSFDNRIENLNKLIELLAAQPAYAPNEPELTVANLTTLVQTMRNANTAVINAYTALSNARIERNNTLYNAATGLLVIAGDVKAYIKSLFGATSPQYKQVSQLKFTKNKL